MKLKDAYYRQNGFVNETYTLDRWLKHKGIYWRWITNAYLQRVYGIKIKPKHRHRRSISYVKMMKLFGNNDNYKFTRIGKTIGRIKHGKFHYTPKRVRLEQIE